MAIIKSMRSNKNVTSEQLARIRRNAHSNATSSHGRTAFAEYDDKIMDPENFKMPGFLKESDILRPVEPGQPKSVKVGNRPISQSDND